MSPTSYQLLHPALFGSTKVLKNTEIASWALAKGGTQ
jgi:hypothetical protein